MIDAFYVYPSQIKMKFIRSSKLSDWCLRVIIEHLDKFIYSKTVPQKYVDFLRKFFDIEIFSLQNTVL